MIFLMPKLNIAKIFRQKGATFVTGGAAEHRRTMPMFRRIES